MTGLTNKQWEQFCLAYVGESNKQQAAIKAGYSVKAASAIASRLLRKDVVLARIAELQDRIATARIMTVIERKERLSEIARARLPDYLVGGEPSIDASSPNSGAIEGYKVNTRFTKEGESVTTREIKLHSPVQAIAELNKMEGEYAPQRTEITGKDGTELKTFVFIMPDGSKKIPGDLISGNSNGQ